jgi:hypothetical protein
MFHKNVFSQIKSQIMHFTQESTIEIDPELKDKIENYLKGSRYNKYRENGTLYIKRINILNEFMLSYKISQVCDLIDIKDIKKYSYNYFDNNYLLQFDKVPFENDWFDVKDFLNKKNKLFSSSSSLQKIDSTKP